MLTITRRADETIVIAGIHVVTVEVIMHNAVQLLISESAEPQLRRQIHRGEGVSLCDDLVRIELTGFHGTSARIGISAPPEISIYRGELADRLRAEGIDITQPLHALPARHTA